MSNMNEEKEKAWKTCKESEINIRLPDGYTMSEKVDRQLKLIHDFGFDDGVKAERERVKNVLMERVGLSAFDEETFKKLFPQEPQQEGER